MVMQWLVDTCVVIRGWEGKGASHTILKRLMSNYPDLAVTDFTLLELKHRAPRHLYKIVNEHLSPEHIFKTGVKPGQWDEERNYDITFDSELLKLIPDPSDAVLIAAAEHYHLNGVITLDRHHLYTARLENYLDKKGLQVLKPNEYVLSLHVL